MQDFCPCLGVAELGSSESDVIVTVERRLPTTATYAAHIIVDGGDKEAAVVVGRNHVATFAHARHEGWHEGFQVQVCERLHVVAKPKMQPAGPAA